MASLPEVVMGLLAAVWTWIGFWSIQHAIRGGFLRQRIRPSRYSKREATGRAAVARGVLYLILGLIFLFITLVVVRQIFEPWRMG